MPDIAQASPRSIAAIGGFRDRDRLVAALQTEFGTDVPDTARVVQAGAFTIACLAPDRFLATGTPDANLAARLAKSLDGLAAVTDQSDMWAAWHVCSPNARDLLARVVPIDLAPSIFQVGDLALTRGGHLDLRVWRTGVDSYEVAVTRSLSADLLHALTTASRPTSQ